MAKLMLVEDDNNLREIYEARLQAEGYQIITAKDGEEALVVAKAEKPDLIIADVMMPKISGFEMLDILRNTDGLKDVKVVMLTALGQDDDQQRANRLGANRYLIKSQVTLEDIVKVAHELLGDAPASAAVTAQPAPVPTPAPQAPSPTTAAPVPVSAPTSVPVSTPPVSVAPSPPTPSPTISIPVTLAPTPTSVPVDATASTPAKQPAATTTATADAQSTVQEEAEVASKVEDFVAGASEEPTPPTGAITADTVPDSAPSPPPTPAPTEPTTAPTALVKPADPAAKLNDDKLMADAAAALVNSTEDKAAGAPPTPADKTPEPSTDSHPASDQSPPQSSDGRTKKTIQPLDASPKKDLDTLLALEEAKADQVKPATLPVAVVASDDPKAQPGSMPQNPVITAPPPEATKPSATAATPPNNPADLSL